MDILQSYCWYVGFNLPILVPWFFAVFYFGVKAAKREAQAVLNLNESESQQLALKTNYTSMIWCMPISVSVPLWTLAQVFVYAALSIGVQYFTVKLMRPDLSDKLLWKWAFKANCFGWSLLSAVISITIGVFLFKLLNK